MMYLNWRGPSGCETLDSLNPADFPDTKALRVEAARLITEYALAGMIGVYRSSRPCKD